MLGSDGTIALGEPPYSCFSNLLVYLIQPRQVHLFGSLHLFVNLSLQRSYKLLPGCLSAVFVILKFQNHVPIQLEELEPYQSTKLRPGEEEGKMKILNC